MIDLSFARTQWPMGHGGFHTGKIQCKDSNVLSYFFDCGGQNTALISDQFERDHYAFGVLSHLHHDHISKISEAKVEKIFLPYMTPIDWLFLVAAQLSEPEGVTQAKGLVHQIGGIIGSKQIIWVRSSRDHREDDETNIIQEPIQKAPGDLTLEGVRPNSRGNIGDGQDIHVCVHSSAQLVKIRFFNYRKDALAKKFSDAVTSQLANIVDESGKPYLDAEGLWEDILTAPARTIERVKAVLRVAYEMAAGGASGTKVAPLNLSSLTMWTSTNIRPRWIHTSVACAHFTHELWDAPFDGWMLTGDLELTDDVWPDFYNHYFSQISRSIAFNVPHHCSSLALGAQAAHYLIGRTMLIACVPAQDKKQKHPSAEFIKLLADRGAGAVPVTEELDAMTSVITSSAWYP